MAGQDQSVNLGGMLTNIADTVGSMGDAYKPVMQAATKPRGDMNDPEHLRRMAEWASNNGDATAASMYAQDARRISTERKKVTDATTINTATSAYKAAREGGDAKAILEAEQALIDAASATGQDAYARLEAVQRGLSQQEEAAYQKQQRELAAKDKAAAEKFTQELNSVSTEEEIQAVVDNADPSVAPIAQRAATQRLQYLEAKTVRAERDRASVQDVSFDSVVINEDLPKAVKAAHAAELKSIQAAAEAGKVNGTWEPGVRDEIIKRREKLADKIYQATYGQEMGEQQLTNQRRRDRDGKAARVAISTPSKSVAADLRKELEQAAEEEAEEGKGWFQRIGQDRGEITTEMVNAEFRRQQMESLNAEYNDVNVTATEDEETTADPEAKRGTAANPISL